jgi:hypothetical protein
VGKRKTTTPLAPGLEVGYGFMEEGGMSAHACTLWDAYRAAIVRTRTASAILEGCESGTPLFGQAVEDLSRCMRAEIEAGRSFMASLESMRSSPACRRQ